MNVAAAATRAPTGERALAARWQAGLRGHLRLEDGRALAVIFPGIPAGGHGPDFTGAVLEAGGDLLRGDVELHLAASGWRQHGHAHDPAYANVVLHVVGVNDDAAVATRHASGRAIAVLVLRAAAGPTFPPPFTPPCALAAARGAAIAPVLARLGERRLRAKAAAAAALAAAAGPAQACYALLLETLAGSANRAAFAELARRLPLAALLERTDGAGAPRALAATAELRAAAAALILRRAGLRPLAAPGRRLEAAGALVARLWPAGHGPQWPPALVPAATPTALRVPGLGRAMALELLVNAVLPVALGSGAWPAEATLAAYAALPSPGTYGRLRPLERWLANGSERPFHGARALQGGLALHRDYCTRGACGRCTLS